MFVQTHRRPPESDGEQWHRVVRQILAGGSEFEQRLRQFAEDERDDDLRFLKAKLRVAGFDASIATHGSSNYRFAHSFIVVRERATDRKYVVDPSFRDQFRLSFATPMYDDLINALPSIAVAREDSFRHAALLTAVRAEKEFRNCGRELPPWRVPGCVARRWQCNV